MPWGEDADAADPAPAAGGWGQDPDASDAEDLNIGGYVAANHPADSSSVAQASDLSKKLGVSVDVALSDLKQANRYVLSQDVDNLTSSNDKAREWANEEPTRGALIRDDAANLHGLMWYMTAGGRGFAHGREGQSVIADQAKDFFGSNTPEQHAALEKAVAAQNVDFGADTFTQKAWMGFTKMLPMMAMDAVSREAGGLLGGIVGGLAGTVVEPGGGTAAGGITAAGIGQQAGSFAFNTYQALGPLWWELSHTKDENGKLLDPQTARAMAGVGAMANGAIMSWTFGLLGSGNSPAASWLRTFTIKRLLSNQPLINGLVKFAGSVSKNYFSGVMLAGAANGVNRVVKDAAKAASGQPFAPFDPMGAVKDTYDGAVQAMTDMAGIALLHPMKDAYHDYGAFKAGKEFTQRLQELGTGDVEMLGKMYRSTEHAATLDALIEGSKTSKLHSLSNEDFQSFVAKVRQTDGAVQAVGMPIEAFDKYWTEKGAKPRDIAAELLGDNGKAYDDATSYKSDFVMPLEKFLGKLAKTPHALGMAPDLRLHFIDGADTFTPREAADFAKNVPAGSVMATVQHDLQTPEQQAETFYRDEHTGVMGQRALDRTPIQPGEVALRVEAGGTAYANDILKDVKLADSHIQDFAKRLQETAGDKLVGRTDSGAFEVRLPASEVEAFKAKLRENAPNREITFGAGETPALASQAHEADKLRAEAAGERAPRGQEPKGWQQLDKNFSTVKARPEIPQHLREVLKGMSQEEIYRSIYLDKHAQKLLSFAGFKVTPPRKYVLVIDAPGLRAMSEAHGDKNGDAMLRGFANGMTFLGGADFDAAHFHGDEFGGKGDDRTALEAFGDNVVKLAGKIRTPFHTETGEFKGALHGTEPIAAVGRTIEEAYRLLAVKKAERGTKAERAQRALDRFVPAEPGEVAGPVDTSGVADSVVSGNNARGGSAQVYARPGRARTPAEQAVANAAPGAVAASARAREESGAGETLVSTPEIDRLRAKGDVEAVKDLARRGAELQSREALNKRDQLTEEAQHEADSHGLYRAQRFLQEGLLYNGKDAWTKGAGVPAWLRTEGGKPFKFDRAEVEALLGKDAVDQLPSDFFAKKGGPTLAADELAGRLGFADARDFFDQSAANPLRSDYINQRVEPQMEALYGSALQRVTENALAARHNEHELKAQLLEIRELAKQVRPEVAARTTVLEPEAQRAGLTQRLEGTSVWQVNPKQFAAQERRALTEATRLKAEGAAEGALSAAQARWTNALMFRLSRDAQADMQGRERALKSAAKSTYRPGVWVGTEALRDAHDAILSALGIGKKVGPEVAFDRAAVDALAADLNTGFTGWAEDVQKLLDNPKPWDELSVSEARNVSNAISEMREAAKRNTTVELEGKRYLKTEFFDQLKNVLEGRKVKAVQPIDKSTPKKGLGLFNAGLREGSKALTPETIARFVDKYAPDGVFRRTFLDPVNAAYGKKTEYLRQFVEPILASYKEMPAELRNRADERIDIWQDVKFPDWMRDKAAPAPVSRSFLWMMFLNMGNSGNKRWLLNSYELSEAQVTGLFDKHLTDPELKFLQNTLDVLHGMREPIAALHERYVGSRLENVEASPIKVRGKEYAGGYFPAKIDSRFSGVGEKTAAIEAAKNVGDFFKDMLTPITTSHSFTNARDERSQQVPDLDWSVLPGHISKVAHDLAFREVVRQSAGLMLDPRFKALDTYFSQGVRENAVAWLQGVATQQSDSLPASMQGTKQVMAFGRSYLTRRFLKTNPASMLGHLWDPVQAAMMGEVSKSSAAWSYIKSMAPGVGGQMRDFAMSNSKVMSRYVEQYEQKLLHQLSLVKASKSKRMLYQATESVLAVHDYMNKFVATVIWSAKYRDAMRAADPSLEPAEAHAQAVRQADSTMQNNLPNNEMGQMSTMLRDKQLLGTTLFAFGYREKTLNLKIQTLDQASLQWQKGGLGNKLSAGSMLVGRLLGSALAGAGFTLFRGHGPDQDEDFGDWLARTALAENFSDFPGISSLTKAAIDSIAKGKVVYPKLTNSPLMEMASDLYNRAAKAATSQDNDALQSTIEFLAGTAGQALGVPLRTDYAAKAIAGNADSYDPLSVGTGLIWGETPKQAANPVSLMTGK